MLGLRLEHVFLYVAQLLQKAGLSELQPLGLKTSPDSQGRKLASSTKKHFPSHPGIGKRALLFREELYPMV